MSADETLFSYQALDVLSVALRDVDSALSWTDVFLESTQVVDLFLATDQVASGRIASCQETGFRTVAELGVTLGQEEGGQESEEERNHNIKDIWSVLGGLFCLLLGSLFSLETGLLL